MTLSEVIFTEGPAQSQAGGRADVIPAPDGRRIVFLNHANPGPIIGNVTSPLFGRANQLSGGAGNGGFSEAANNRRLELQTRFTF